MQMRRVFATAGKIALGCFVVLACAAVATVGTYLALGLSAGSLRSPVPSPDATLVSPSTTPPETPVAESATPETSAATTPSEILAARFPPEANPQAPTFSTASMIPGENQEPFDLNALSGMATTDPQWPSVDGAAASAALTPEEMDPTRPPSGPAGGAAPHRTSARSPNVLNDAMIASIRQRLKLTVEQQKLWPPVESALRKIVYTRTAMNPQGRAQPTAYIDPTSAEVRELKSAALPLIMRLSDEQRREVKMLAYVMGLEAVVSQF